MTYRREIDGLRAVAVIPVVLFHVGLGARGGYIGVDVFFVISGFLITSLIVRDLERGSFSLAEFWARRVRRIMPAATVAVLGTLAMGSLILLPSDLEDLGRSAVAQALLAGNFYFYATSGYFSAPAETKPLLHFWSLAVEEQFYLLFPLLLLACWRWTVARAQTIVAVIAVVSLVWSVIGVYRFPDSTFYLLPARAWELALGALLALHAGRLPLPESAKPVGGWLGLAMILLPVFFYDARTPFPGLAAVPPCVGTVLIIWATAGRSGGLRQVLSLPPFVFIGLISYSLYLWHWPLQVMVQFWRLGNPPTYQSVGVFIVSVVVAYLSWRYVEQPFRQRTAGLRRRTLFAGAVAATAVVIILGGGLARLDGLPFRFPDRAIAYAAAREDQKDAAETDVHTDEVVEDELPKLSEHFDGQPRILLWGDSHGRAVSPALEQLSELVGHPGVRATRSATPPVLGWGARDKQKFNAAVMAWIQENQPEIVVLVARWTNTLKTEEQKQQLLATTQAISATGAQVWIMQEVPFLREDVPIALARSVLLKDDPYAIGIPVEEHTTFTAQANAALAEVAATDANITLLDPVPYLSVDGLCPAKIDGEVMYYDHHHLTGAGARRLTPLFAGAYEDWRRTRQMGATERRPPVRRGRRGKALAFRPMVRSWHPARRQRALPTSLPMLNRARV